MALRRWLKPQDVRLRRRLHPQPHLLFPALKNTIRGLGNSSRMKRNNALVEAARQRILAARVKSQAKKLRSDVASKRTERRRSYNFARAVDSSLVDVSPLAISSQFPRGFPEKPRRGYSRRGYSERYILNTNLILYHSKSVDLYTSI